MQLNQKAGKTILAAFFGLGLLAAITLLANYGYEGASLHSAAAAATKPLNQAQQKSVDYADTLSQAFRTASERVLPSVVTIQVTSRQATTQNSTNDDGAQNGLPDDLLKDPFFKRFFPNLPDLPRGVPQIPQRQGMGSGVIIDPSGIVLTNNHVVAGGGNVVVRLHDGREFPAVEVKTDPQTDLAVVKIDAGSSLPSAVIGDSDTLEIGDWVLAVGAPFGLNETVTAGIISAKSRGVGLSEREDFLQTDAAINPGNSGGPLVNLNGEIVGINTAISSASGGYDGIGFAIPVNLAKWVSDQLRTRGTVERAFLGIGIQPMTDALSKQFGTKTIQGALVTEVRPDSPAAKAGLKSGDVVVEFDGKPIATPRDLQGFVERAAIGKAHSVVVMRDGKSVTVSVPVERMPENYLAGASQTAKPAPSEFSDIGLEVADIGKDVAQQLGISDTAGVVVTNVTPGSPAERSGITATTVITKVGQKAVGNVDEFRAALKDHKLADGILLLVRTAEGSRFVVVKDQ